MLLAAATCVALGAVSVAQDAAQSSADAAATPGAQSLDHQRPQTRGPGHGPRRRQLRPEQIEEALDIVDQIDPHLAQRLRGLHDDDPQQVIGALHQHMPRIGRFIAWRRYDPVLFRLRIDEVRLACQTEELSIDYQKAGAEQDQSKLNELKTQLTDLITERFELQQAIREHQIERLQQRLDALHEQLAEEETQKYEIIQDRVQALLDNHAEPETP